MRNKKTIGILGAGKWGTALAIKLENSCHLKLYSRDLESPFKKLGKLEYYREIDKIKGSDLIIIAVLSFVIRKTANLFKPFYSGQPILGVSKGIEKETSFLPSQILKEIFGDIKYAHLSGPSFAEEVVNGLPTVVSLGMSDISQKKYFQDFFNLKNFKIKETQDLIGVQLGEQ